MNRWVGGLVVGWVCGLVDGWNDGWIEWMGWWIDGYVRMVRCLVDGWKDGREGIGWLDVWIIG